MLNLSDTSRLFPIIFPLNEKTCGKSKILNDIIRLFLIIIPLSEKTDGKSEKSQLLLISEGIASVYIIE